MQKSIWKSTIPVTVSDYKTFTRYSKKTSISKSSYPWGGKTPESSTPVKKTCVKSCWGSEKKSLSLCCFMKAQKACRSMPRIFKYLHKSKPAFCPFPRNWSSYGSQWYASIGHVFLGEVVKLVRKVTPESSRGVGSKSINFTLLVLLRP